MHPYAFLQPNPDFQPSAELKKINDVFDELRVVRSIKQDLQTAIERADSDVYELTSFILRGKPHAVTKESFEDTVGDFILRYQASRKKEFHIIDSYLSLKAEEEESIADGSAPLPFGHNDRRRVIDDRLSQIINSYSPGMSIQTKENITWQNPPSMPGGF